MNCPNGHVSTSTAYCSVCGVKMIADSEPAPAEGAPPVISVQSADASPDDAVSHRHAKIEVDPDGNAFLVDVGSTNGTMVNGQVIAANTPIKLKDSDRISLGGKTTLIVHGPQN